LILADTLQLSRCAKLRHSKRFEGIYSMAWVDDGSCAVKVDGEECKIDGAPAGSPANAYFGKPLSSGDYFEIDILETKQSPFIGITSSAAFAEGWKCKGLLFGGPGNLSDGSALVRGEFGEEIKKGMTVGTLLKMDSGSITVTFYQEGRCLGPAFIAKRLSDAAIFPLVHGRDGDHFRIRFPDTVPTMESRQAKSGEAVHPAEGTWALKQLCVGPELHEFPLAAKMEGETVMLKITETSPTFSFSARVINNLNFVATSMADAGLAPFEKLEIPGPLISTQMMGPESMMEVETKISEGLQNLHKWLPRSDSLLMVGPATEMSFTRFLEESIPASHELA